MKKVLSILIIAVLLLSALPVAAGAAGAEPAVTGAYHELAETGGGTTGDCSWDYSNGKLTISGNGKMHDYTGVLADSDGFAPWYKYKEEITSVVVKSGVTHIGQYSFKEFSKLTSVSIADTVTTIGDSAFFKCSSLKSITLPKNMEELGGIFTRCTALKSIKIPESVTSIGSYAFYYCTSLETVEFPANLRSIDSYAFFNCTSLKSVTLGKKISSLERYSLGYLEGYEKDTGFTIRGYTGTQAEKYATLNKFSFVSIGIVDTVVLQADCTVTVPQEGALPDTAPVSADSSKYSVKVLYWYRNETGYPKMTTGERFVDGKKYSVVVEFTPKGDYVFNRDTSYKINGRSTSSNTSGAQIREAAFTVGTIKITSAIAFIDKPVAGNTPDFEPESGDHMTYDVEVHYWMLREGYYPLMKSTDTFEAGKRYTLRLKFIPKEGYSFADSVVYYINGEKAKHVSDNIFEVIYPCTDTITNVDVTGVTAPIAGQAPSFDVQVPADKGYKIKSMTWFIGDSYSDYVSATDTFQNGQEYRLIISLERASDVYSFTTDKNLLKGTINGEACTIYNSYFNGDKEVQLTKTYTCSASSNTYTVGDVNSDDKVDNRDAMILDRYIAEWAGYADRIKNMDTADIDRKGSVDNRDAMILDRVVAGWQGYYEKYCIMVTG